MRCLPWRFVGNRCYLIVVGIVLSCLFTSSALARHSSRKAVTPPDPQSRPPFDQKLFGEMRWRCIGPFRGGRTVAISGVPHQPNIFYMAAVNGGVWKTSPRVRWERLPWRRPTRM